MKGANITLSFNMQQIYDNASFVINDEDKVGIVGVNGAGKTTLLRIINKELSLDSGNIIINKNKKIGYLPQEIKDDNNETVLDYLLSGRPIKELEIKLTNLYEIVGNIENEKEQNKVLREISDTQEMLEYYDCYNAENVLFEILEKMHIPYDILDLKFNILSGGQKSKVAFAKLLYSSPEIILLDEPTNHLDFETKEYVINYLKQYKGMVLVISHDIEFLDLITNKTLHIDKETHKITIYDGNYTTFFKKYNLLQEHKEKLADKQNKENDRLRNFILQYSNSSGKRKKIAQSREKLLEKKMKEQIIINKNNKKVKFNIVPKTEGSKIPLKINNLNFNYLDGPLLFNNLSFLINNKERFLIVGENGVGKSTLLKIIYGSLFPISGDIIYGAKTELAYYTQELEIINENKTILENVDNKEYSERELRTILGNFLFTGDDIYKKASVLSPGEKARLSLCLILLKRANLLLLDEPTNHLDPETQKTIGVNFKNYDGTIIVDSHNESFIETLNINRMLILPIGKIVNYSKENFDTYYLKKGKS